jgi:RND family efflux transporter MFP subunit
MSRKDFRFWITFIILIGISCEAAFYFKHHMVVKTRAIAAEEAARNRAAELAAGPIASKQFKRQDLAVTLSAIGTIGTNQSDPTYADISFTLPEENLDSVDEGQEVTFIVDELPGLFFKGEVYALESKADPDTHEFAVQAMASNTDDKLQPGMTTQLEMVTDIHQNAMVIPESALIDKDDKSFVYVVENGKAKLTPVTIGVHQDDQVEITEGSLDDKDIIVAGTDHIHDGEPVVIEKPAAKDESSDTDANGTADSTDTENQD